jgi:cell division protein FtsZ
MECSIKGAKGVILNVTGGQDIGIFEVEAASEHLRAQIDPEANFIWGFVQDDNMDKDSQDEIQMVVIATGFDLGTSPAEETGRMESPESSPRPQKISSSENDSFFSMDSPIDTPSYLRRRQRQ